MKLANIMSSRPVSVPVGTDLTLARHTMAWANVRHLPIVDEGGMLVGMLTERDILRQLSRERDLGGVGTEAKIVDTLMTREVQTASGEDSLTEAAARLADSNIGCLPITEKGRLVGLVTRTDVLRGEVRDSMSGITSLLVAGDLMTEAPATVKLDDYLLNAAGRMQSLGVRHLPVVNGANELVGMLSDRDVRGAVGDPMRIHDNELRVQLNLLRVGDAMTADVLVASESDSLGTIAMMFVDHRLSAAPVVNDQGALVGIISYLDLLRASQ